MEWLLILQLLNPGAEVPTITTEAYESRTICEQHATDLGRALGVKDGSKTVGGGEVMLQCVAKVARV